MESIDDKMRHSKEGFNVVNKIDRQRTKSMIELEKEIEKQEEQAKKDALAAASCKRRKTEMVQKHQVDLTVNEISAFADDKVSETS